MPALLVLLVCLVVAAPAQAATERPIVYAISIDGLDGDAVDAGSAPFVASLLDGRDARASYFPESRSVIPAETNPNHTAMVTGAYPGASGIAANAFALYAPLESGDSCRPTGPFDFTRAPTPTSGEESSCLLADSIFSAVKRQGNPDELTTAVIMGKPKLGRIFAGRTVDPGERDADYLWAPCADGADDDDYCVDVPTNPATGYAVDDRTVMDEVIRTATEGVPAGDGQTRRPDFTFVNLPQVDSAGHATGRGLIYDVAVSMADAEIERLVSALKAQGEWDRTVLVLLSDHSMDTTPAKVTAADAFTGAGIAEDEFVIVQNGSLDSVYLADRTDPGRFALLARMRAAVLAQDGVSEALYREPNPSDGGDEHAVDTVHPQWRLAGERSGDLIVTSDAGVAFSDPSSSSNPLIGNHGAPQTRDNFFAVVGGGDLVRQQTVAGEVGPLFDDTARNPQQAENVDLAPTVMGLFGLAAPRNSRGRYLANAFDRAELPGAGRPTGRPALKVKARSARNARRCAYRVTWGPKGGRFDVQARRAGRWRPLRRGTRSVRLAVKGRRGQRFRVRSRAASGVAGAFRTRRGRC